MDYMPPELVRKAEVYFNKYDQDKSNSIEINELKDLMSDLAKEIKIPLPSEQDVSVIMDDTDLNQDRRISREEFVNLFRIIYAMKSMSKK
jgi:Ca2+-binding EF-hand superfamily protein